MQPLRSSHEPTEVDEAPPGALRVRLAAVERRALRRSSPLTVAERPTSSLTGPTVAASNGRRLVVVCGQHDGSISVQAGSWPELRDLAVLDPCASDAAVPVALVPWGDEWHLFGRCRHGGSVHLVATADLATWRVRPTLGAGFPAFVVSGACATPDGLLLAGRVLVDRLAFGWALLATDGESFSARQVPVPLASPLGVLGPVADTRGQVVVVQSGTRCTVARSEGAGWTLSPLRPRLSPTAVFVVDGAAWVAGYDTDTHVMRLASIDSDTSLELDDADPAAPALVSAAVRHGPHVVLVRER